MFAGIEPTCPADKFWDKDMQSCEKIVLPDPTFKLPSTTDPIVAKWMIPAAAIVGIGAILATYLLWRKA